MVKTETKIMAPEVLLGEYRRIFQEEESVQTLPLLISGNSMSPFLIHGRDTVFLSRMTRPVRRGDMLLYQRANGAYVLHRVYAVTPAGYTMVGDAQTVLETGIRPEQVIAIVTKVIRKGKNMEPGCFWWGFFETIWIRIVPLRKLIWKIYSLVR